MLFNDKNMKREGDRWVEDRCAYTNLYHSELGEIIYLLIVCLLNHLTFLIRFSMIEKVKVVRSKVVCNHKHPLVNPSGRNLLELRGRILWRQLGMHECLGKL